MDLDPKIQERVKALSDIQLCEMGRVVVYWSVLENTVNGCLGTALGLTVGETLAVVTPIRNFRQRLSVLLHAFKEKHGSYRTEADITELLAIVKDVERLYSVRNRVAHGIWRA